MAKTEIVKPYLKRIKNWKTKNMVLLYLEAKDKFSDYDEQSDEGSISFNRMREICDILFDIKEDFHLLYNRLIDPNKNRFENAEKFMPDNVETSFMNNVGLLFHKMMVVRELKYLLEHYVDSSEVFEKNNDNLQIQLSIMNDLFNDGLDILSKLIYRNKGNRLLLTGLLENHDLVERHFGQSAAELIEQCGNGKGLADIYYLISEYYLECGRKDKARVMLQTALQKNSAHKLAKQSLTNLN